ncbi:conserved hypothetical protein [Xylanimonas cellulosilytica DSM 15894]|uniref:AMIN-like domain-containing protein n=1 Tax=Xylanimonas cellulosilytica (strain DSM 15894 / JCM 12276 / CECT 5975 / KCTC 9989 / LMG 20990 / NBRC 107835 / XIL07) TaxID=446471 RepID=D1BV70_XYLCX|nr:hypothetical protein [Xylanimonas cellulosilytica]ACZ31309.1 conserved hypothetical protein [Xylanimonas cellulosilytica DSM 15894]
MSARAFTARTFTAGACAAGLLALALAGCAGSGEDPGDGTGTDTATASESPATEEPTPTETTDDTSPTPMPSPTGPEVDEPGTDLPFVDPGTVAEAEPGDDALLSVTDVRVASHDTFDRVVFDLEGTGTPGWRVEYVDEALDDGSGLPVEVDGDGVLQVRISGTGMPMDTGVDEFSGGTVELDGESVEEVVYRFVFEGYSTAFVGTDDRAPFRVFTLENPTRLVVDVQH